MWDIVLGICNSAMRIAKFGDGVSYVIVGGLALVRVLARVRMERVAVEVFLGLTAGGAEVAKSAL